MRAWTEEEIKEILLAKWPTDYKSEGCLMWFAQLLGIEIDWPEEEE